MEKLTARLYAGGVTPGAVLYIKAQNLTEEQKLLARANIGAIGEMPDGSTTIVQSTDVKYFRITEDGVLEWSVDGSIWNSVNIGGTVITPEGEIPEGETVVIISDNIKALRITGDNKLEWSPDLVNWYTVAGTGGSADTLPIASATQLGGIKIGEGLAIDGDGVLSVTGAVSDLPDGDGVSY